MSSNSTLKKCTENRDKAHLKLRMKMRMIGGWLENSDFEWTEAQIDSELSSLETSFDKVCDAHAELVNAVKHTKSQDPDDETLVQGLDNFIMDCTDKIGELKAKILARKGKNPVIVKMAALTSAASEESLHTDTDTVGSAEDGQTAREGGEDSCKRDQDKSELKFAIQGKEGSFLTFAKRGDRYFCQNCKAPQGSKPDRRKRAETEGIKESSIREHARDEHRLKVSWSQVGHELKSATELPPISCQYCGKAFKRYHQGCKNHEEKCSQKPAEKDVVDTEKGKTEPASKRRRHVNNNRDNNAPDPPEHFASTSRQVFSSKNSEKDESITITQYQIESIDTNSVGVRGHLSQLSESNIEQGRVRHAEDADIPIQAVLPNKEKRR